MAYTLDNLRTDIRNYTEVDNGHYSKVLTDSVLELLLKMQKIEFKRNRY